MSHLYGKTIPPKYDSWSFILFKAVFDYFY